MLPIFYKFGFITSLILLFSEQMVLEEGDQLKNEQDDSDDEEDEVEGKSDDYSS